MLCLSFHEKNQKNARLFPNQTRRHSNCSLTYCEYIWGQCVSQQGALVHSCYGENQLIMAGSYGALPPLGSPMYQPQRADSAAFSRPSSAASSVRSAVRKIKAIPRSSSYGEQVNIFEIHINYQNVYNFCLFNGGINILKKFLGSFLFVFFQHFGHAGKEKKSFAASKKRTCRREHKEKEDGGRTVIYNEL